MKTDFFENDIEREKRLSYNARKHAYVEATHRKEYIGGNQLLQRGLLNPSQFRPSTITKFRFIVGCDVEELPDMLGINDYELAAYKRGELEIAHIIPWAWFLRHPRYMPYAHRFYNIKLQTSHANKIDSDSIELNDYRVIITMLHILREEINDRADRSAQDKRLEAILARMSEPAKEPWFSGNEYDGYQDKFGTKLDRYGNIL